MERTKKRIWEHHKKKSDVGRRKTHFVQSRFCFCVRAVTPFDEENLFLARFWEKKQAAAAKKHTCTTHTTQCKKKTATTTTAQRLWQGVRRHGT